jgi:D-glycero-D-manno-heptose 1,7-bisphosphate phosphatase
MKRAVFLDRDGVLVRDIDYLTAPSQIEILPGVPEALRRLRQAGFELLAVTNQPIVARGMVTETELRAIHDHMQSLLRSSGACLTEVYYCPHHPKATLPEYRVLCDCRKPKPGLLLRAAEERGINLAGSFMVGDRISDVATGAAVGCRTILVHSGKHLDPPITGAEHLDPNLRADYTCPNLSAAALWIGEQQ